MPTTILDTQRALANDLAANERRAAQLTQAEIEDLAVLAGWNNKLVEAVFGDATQLRLQRTFHRCRVDTLWSPQNGQDAQQSLLAGAQPKMIEINNGGSQGHWLASAALLTWAEATGSKIKERAAYRLTRLPYAHFTWWLRQRLGTAVYRRLFGSRPVPMVFVTAPYSGRMLNDVEGPRLADFWQRHSGTPCEYHVGLSELALGDTVETPLGPLQFVRTRDGANAAVWADLYLTASKDWFCEQLNTSAVAQAMAAGTLAGICSWPGRELLQNDKAVLQHNDSAAETHCLTAEHVSAVLTSPCSWVIKRRWGFGGDGVFVGARPGSPHHRIVDRHGNATTLLQLCHALDFGVVNDRFTADSWYRLWPRIVLAALNTGMFIVQRAIPAVTLDVELPVVGTKSVMIDFNLAFSVFYGPKGVSALPTGWLSRAAAADQALHNVNQAGGFLPALMPNDYVTVS